MGAEQQLMREYQDIRNSLEILHQEFLDEPQRFGRSILETFLVEFVVDVTDVLERLHIRVTHEGRQAR